jgi:hypothetical protein
MIWLVLQATPLSVRGGSLRGISSSSSSSGVARRLPTCPLNGQAKIFIGHHKIDKKLPQLNQAVLWVVSPFTSHYDLENFTWEDMPSDAPTEVFYKKKVNHACYHLFTVGAGGKSPEEPEVLTAGINRKDDRNKPFLDPVFVTNRNTADLTKFKTAIDKAIKTVNANFAAKLDPNDPTKKKTLLKYKLIPHDNWYQLGHGWEEFNTNGFMTGLITTLGSVYNAALTKDTSTLPGWNKPVPPDFFNISPTTSTSFTSMKSSVYKTEPCVNHPPELWVGYHTDLTNKVATVDHAKIWVIQSTTATLTSDWNDISPEMVPPEYAGDKNCAKFFSLSSAFGHGSFGGILNDSTDLDTNLLGAVKATFALPGNILSEITKTNPIIQANFDLLKGMTAFPQDWNQWDIGWKEFNGNGYVSGFLNYLAHLTSGDHGNELGTKSLKPKASFLEGWDKDVPIEFFESTMSADNMKAVVDKHHDAEYTEVIEPDAPDLTAGKEEQQSTLDP